MALLLIVISVFWSTPAGANTCLQPHQVAALTTPLPKENGDPDVQTVNTCGGDDVSYNIPLSGPVVFDGVTFNSLYVTTNSVIAFGQPDGTFHDFPMTPSISLFSQDWVAYPQWKTDEAFTIAHSHQGFQVTLKVRPYSNQNTPTLTTIVFTASYNQDRTLNISYYADNVTQYQTRTGVRLNNGTVVPFSQAGIVQAPTIPVVPGDPEPDPAPTITGTEAGDAWAKVFVQSSNAVTATAWRYQVTNTQQSCVNPYSGQTITTDALSESILLSGLTNGCQYTVRVAHWGESESLYAETVVTPVMPFIEVPTDVQATLDGNTITITWEAPTEFTVPIERYAIFWSYDNFETGEATSSTTTSATITVPSGVTVSIKIRADNDSEVVFSDFSEPVVVVVPPAAGPIPSPEPSPDENAESEQQPSTPVTPEPEPSQEPSQEPTIPPQPQEPEPPIQPTPEPVAPSPEPSPNPPITPVDPIIPEPEGETQVEPKPEPTPVPPTEEPAPKPTPSEEPIEEPEENEPEPLPEPEPSSPSEELGELANIDPSDLTDEQALELFALALEVFETAEVGSEEYQQALNALMIVAQSDDPELPAALAAIPLLGDVAGAILDIFNSLGNVGADMSPQVRETAEKIVVVSIVVTQIVAVTALGAMASTSIRRP
jgi:hypothetical protein